MADKLYVDIDKAVGIGYLSDWYQSSIDDTISPIWTDEHLMELVNDFLIIPNDTPTADVVEVKHGKWIEKFKNGFWYYDCPFCGDGYVLMERDENKPNYCHNCGAKMDGRKDE